MNKTPIHLKPLPEPRLEMINLIDVLITLVAFFMLTSTFIVNQSYQNIGVDLPRVRNDATASQAASRLVIELNKEHQLFYQRQPIDLWDLKELFKRQAADTVVIIRADQDCQYSWIVELLDTAAGCRLNKLALEVRKS
jgi:biopolymer transport protein ExbD